MAQPALLAPLSGTCSGNPRDPISLCSRRPDDSPLAPPGLRHRLGIGCVLGARQVAWFSAVVSFPLRDSEAVCPPVACGVAFSLLLHLQTALFLTCSFLGVSKLHVLFVLCTWSAEFIKALNVRFSGVRDFKLSC